MLQRTIAVVPHFITAGASPYLAPVMGWPIYVLTVEYMVFNLEIRFLSMLLRNALVYKTRECILEFGCLIYICI
jgi:hypothetical protein